MARAREGEGTAEEGLQSGAGAGSGWARGPEYRVRHALISLYAVQPCVLLSRVRDSLAEPSLTFLHYFLQHPAQRIRNRTVSPCARAAEKV